MTIDTPVADITAFDFLRKGASAPQWLASGLIDAWGLPALRTQITLISVSENANFLIAVDGEPYAVARVSRPGYLEDPSYIEGEIAWVAAVRRDTSLSVPEHLVTVHGGYHAVVIDGDGAPWTCATTAFVAGGVLEDLGDPAPHLVALGRASAVLHEHARRWVAPVGFRRFSWDLTDMVGDAPRWGRWDAAPLDDAQRSLLTRAEAKARGVIAGVEKTAQSWGIIHADLRPSNVIHHEGDLTIIDFDDAGFGWYLFDFAAALSFMEHTDQATEMARNWIAGYRQVLDLGEQELRIACALSMVRRLQMLGWTVTHRADALPEELYRESVPGSCTVAERYLADELWLVRGAAR